MHFKQKGQYSPQVYAERILKRESVGHYSIHLYLGKRPQIFID